ncbi:MAG TPA: hypothetical protein VHA82_04700 [Ramlibacter sp.]|uniref:hypothetical protein n=1 Tax=Ramlibacter sp. TaxID=1917967 RepID=UPI002BE8D710|nr:hypothetical protein [Ramlibacter sp.]HVZ43089.1 hypothetical protein [Ramlibacter sp.]
MASAPRAREAIVRAEQANGAPDKPQGAWREPEGRIGEAMRTCVAELRKLVTAAPQADPSMFLEAARRVIDGRQGLENPWVLARFEMDRARLEIQATLLSDEDLPGVGLALNRLLDGETPLQMRRAALVAKLDEVELLIRGRRASHTLVLLAMAACAYNEYEACAVNSDAEPIVAALRDSMVAQLNSSHMNVGEMPLFCLPLVESFEPSLRALGIASDRLGNGQLANDLRKLLRKAGSLSKDASLAQQIALRRQEEGLPPGEVTQAFLRRLDETPARLLLSSASMPDELVDASIAVQAQAERLGLVAR